jgi:glucoamylase
VPRDIPVGNESLLITFDQDYCLRDIYYPCVGKENHTNGHKFRLGVWVDGRFDWIKRENWYLNLEYIHESLLTSVTARNEILSVSLYCNDMVDYREIILWGMSNVSRCEGRLVILCQREKQFTQTKGRL